MSSPLTRLSFGAESLRVILGRTATFEAGALGLVTLGLVILAGRMTEAAATSEELLSPLLRGARVRITRSESQVGQLRGRALADFGVDLMVALEAALVAALTALARAEKSVVR